MEGGGLNSRDIIVTASCPPGMRKRDGWRIDQFHLLKKIGSGYASTVYLATCKATGNQVAMKLYHKNKLSELNFFQVTREIKIHSSLDHKNIIQLWAAFEDQYGVYLVSEFAGKGDVFADVEKRGGTMSEAETVRQVIHPFLNALVYLHGLNIMHRDIKPENLLFTTTDFGLSINFESERPVTRVGTLDYMAPEVVTCPDKRKPSDHKEMKHLYYTPVVDAWAVGVLAYELIVGRPPFDKGHKKLTIAEIVKGEPAIPGFVAEDAAAFIRWALTKEKTRRPTVQQLSEHSWVMNHMAAPVPRRTDALRVMMRADSFKEPRSLGVHAAVDSAGSRLSGFEQVVQNLQVHALQQTRVLGLSNSMNAASMMRWRDIAFNANPEETYDNPGVLTPKRRSDGADSQPGSKRSSFASGAGSLLPRPPTAVEALARTPGALSRMNSGAMSPDPRSPSREELIASLQASAQKLNKSKSFSSSRASSPLVPVGAGRHTVFAATGTPAASPPAGPAAAYQRGMVQRSNSLHVARSGSPGAQAQAGSPSHSPSRHHPLYRQLSANLSRPVNGVSPSGTIATDAELIQRLGSTKGPTSADSLSSSHRPQPPPCSPRSQHFSPSRLGSSAVAAAPNCAGRVVRSVGPEAFQLSGTSPPGHASPLKPKAPQESPLSSPVEPLPIQANSAEGGAAAVAALGSAHESTSLLKSAKGIFGGLKKVFL